jgi:hypothetical protein
MVAMVLFGLFKYSNPAAFADAFACTTRQPGTTWICLDKACAETTILSARLSFQNNMRNTDPFTCFES